MGPTVGALRRTLAADVATTPKRSSRAFSLSARRVEESTGAAPSAPASANPDSRRARTANALSQITRLGANRRTAGIQPGGLAKGNFPSGQTDGQPGRGPPRVRPEGSLKITREATGPEGARRGAPQPGAMARAPAQLKLSRNSGSRAGSNASVGGRRGPNLRGRDEKPGGPGNRSRDGPNKRTGSGGDEERVDARDIKFENTLSDGMVQHLLRLQRGQWDRKPYEPKYAPGSFAANQLIHQGRELFRGEAPPVKIWGRLEKTIGVVGMHNAEAHLKVRRLTDLDDESLGDRRQHFENGDVDIPVIGKAPQASKAAAETPAMSAPAAVTQAAAAKVSAPEQALVAQ
ncbi:uncharacterized protein M421DRAFT_417094 [Didymella exigua CBS 183.55]|uniref:Uncharacterized protein n=1 Tax=Didymella exigua CBS 183.55 TaxID=1150837 RepID=A0A6A5RV77_9PLEO|nr:uncharacterized protein M421DRAFT_417094 [Didymella exigua CBS 183.55]KAF1932375.1 hypothetical protein M421DRAFT_417094 [Didymella exigua CBS 183.55]